MGFLFQGGALFDSMTVAENIAFPIRQHQDIKDKQKLDEIIKSKLMMVGLDGFQDYFPAKLSGGQKKGSHWQGPLRSILRLFFTMSRRRDLTLSGPMLSMS
jgi:ABC-type uncharacterized transport system YnjBCD ATPase subunit